MYCPKCGSAQPDDNVCCTMCGIVFAKFGEISPPASTKLRLDDIPIDSITYSHPNERRTNWKATGISFLIAVAVTVVGIIGNSSQTIFGFLLAIPSMAFRYLSVLIHEMGHAILAWIFAYPAIPAFDFSYGGGVTVWQSRKTLVLIFVYLLMLAPLVRYIIIKRKRAVIVLSIAIVIYTSLAFVKAHNVIILFMGHGMELVFAGIFIYRFLSGNSILSKLERPLYGILGFFMVNELVIFSFKLMFSSIYKQGYHDAKGGGHWMDFDRIANDYFHCSLELVAFFFLLCCLATPVIAYLAKRYEEKWKTVLARTFSLH